MAAPPPVLNASPVPYATAATRQRSQYASSDSAGWRGIQMTGGACGCSRRTRAKKTPCVPAR
eukprot:5730336-Alexandrium_andersonii.AAC.1